MPDIIALPGREFILGETKLIGVTNVRSRDAGSLSGTTGSVTVVDSTGATVVSSGMTVTYNADSSRVTATYALATGSGKTITTAATYRALYTLTFPDTTIQIWQQTITVKAFGF